MSRAKETLEYMAEVKARLSYPDVQAYTGAVYKSVTRSVGVASEVADKVIARTMIQGLEHAEAYHLTQDMAKVVEWAAKTLDETDEFTTDLWPSAAGFLLLEDAHIVADARGKILTVKALLWTPINGGVLVVEFVDSHDPRDEVSAHMRATLEEGPRGLYERIGRLHAAHFRFIPHGYKVGPPMVSNDYTQFDDDESAPPLLAESENGNRFLLSFLLMLNQTIVRTEREDVNKRQAASLAKRRLPSMVTVIHMRRVEHAGRREGESHVEWQRRWVTRGHWRNQPVGPNYPGGRMVNGKRVARIWIAPYIKGPSWAPLVVPDKVYSLDR